MGAAGVGGIGRSGISDAGWDCGFGAWILGSTARMRMEAMARICSRIISMGSCLLERKRRHACQVRKSCSELILRSATE